MNNEPTQKPSMLGSLLLSCGVTVLVLGFFGRFALGIFVVMPALAWHYMMEDWGSDPLRHVPYILGPPLLLLGFIWLFAKVVYKLRIYIHNEDKS